MKNRVTWIIQFLINKLKSIQKRIIQENNSTDLGYSSLSPIDDGDITSIYYKSLKWAIENRKDKEIRNIALTGSYGSGKSTILKSFKNNYSNKNVKFLNISLATFSEEEEAVESKKDKAELSRLIEISILQQIFYHEKDSKIPDSRFKKIKSYSKFELFLLAGLYSIFLVSALLVLFPNFFARIFPQFNEKFFNIDYILYSIVILGIYVAVKKSIRIIDSITINKLIVKNAEFGLGESKNKSILNNHIDEILYFFTVRPYNVVVIEDLDRFKQTDIFTKLREINSLLNNSLKLKNRAIVFIYAVRDDIFKGNDRTKFFDFIIPVIPVINPSNSADILYQKNNILKFQLSKKIIDDISFYVNDMRLLHNISNEFVLYRNRLSPSLNDDKLFAMVLYKNLYPADYALLSNFEGKLYNLFQNKNIFLKRKVEQLKEKISEIKGEILTIEKTSDNTLRSLRGKYVYQILLEVPRGFAGFQIDGNNIELSEVVNDDYFNKIKNDDYKVLYLQENSYNQKRAANISKKFGEIESEVDERYTYEELETIMLKKENSFILKAQHSINQFEQEIVESRNLTISQLISNNSYDFEFETEEASVYKSLINILIRNGYISEDYINYLSLFHEGSISRSDYEFIINTKNGKDDEFEMNIDKVQNVIEKIGLSEFHIKPIYNYGIFDFIVGNIESYRPYFILYIQAFKKESKSSDSFLIGFLDITKNLKAFILGLYENWENVWNYFNENSSFTEEQKNTFFKYLITYLEVEEIVDLSKFNNVVEKIEKSTEFLTITNDYEKVGNILERLDVKFDRLVLAGVNRDFVEFIVKLKGYKVNLNNVQEIFKTLSQGETSNFEKENYYAIRESKIESLIEYIEEEINDYVKNVYLRLRINRDEPEDSLLILLNNEKLQPNLKERIVEKVETKISVLKELSDSDLRFSLLHSNKVEPTWENIIYLFEEENMKEDEEELIEEFVLPKGIIDFLNADGNSTALRESGIKDKEDDEFCKQIFETIFNSTELSDEAFENISKISLWEFSKLMIRDFSGSKISCLIVNGVLDFNYEYLEIIRTSFPSRLDLLLSVYFYDYIEIVKKESEIKLNELVIVLNSRTFDVKMIQETIDNSKQDIIKDFEVEKRLLELYNTSGEDSLQLTSEVIKSILLNANLLFVYKLKIFGDHAKSLGFEFIKEFIHFLGEPYVYINNKNIRAQVIKEESNLKLLDILESSGYISSYTDLGNGMLRVYHKRS